MDENKRDRMDFLLNVKMLSKMKLTYKERLLLITEILWFTVEEAEAYENCRIKIIEHNLHNTAKIIAARFYNVKENNFYKRIMEEMRSIIDILIIETRRIRRKNNNHPRFLVEKILWDSEDNLGGEHEIRRLERSQKQMYTQELIEETTSEIEHLLGKKIELSQPALNVFIDSLLTIEPNESVELYEKRAINAVEEFQEIIISEARAQDGSPRLFVIGTK